MNRGTLTGRALHAPQRGALRAAGETRAPVHAAQERQNASAVRHLPTHWIGCERLLQR